MSDFDRALAFVLRWEGGYVDHPSDPGGATNRGITGDTLRAWRLKQELPPADVRDLTEEEARAIYRAWYWEAGQCHRMAWPLSLAHFDGVVQRGPVNAAKMLQEVVGVTADGIIGPKTRAAIDGLDPARVAEDLCWTRLAHYRRRCLEDPRQRDFLLGWLGRALALEAEL